MPALRQLLRLPFSREIGYYGWGPAWVLPNADSSEVTGLPGSGVDVDSAVTLGFTVGYMFTDNLGIELLGVVPPEHDLEGDGSIAGSG